ncbi:MAG: ATP-binding protein, partial [Flavobacteriales bacterium]|nr:ATP-binding protein [Flavobacteriales bacterium]
KAENIQVAERFIDDLCSKLEVHESQYGNILIALTEAVNNAIHHGNRQDPSKKVSMGHVVKDGNLIVQISDEGPGFDHEHLPDPTDPQNIEKPHGRGVFLMRALASSVEFAENGSTVTLAFSLAPMEE